MLAGPELGIGLELMVLMDALGVEFFILAMTAPLWVYGYRFKALLGRLDPYFFIASRSQLAQCPALLSHAIPFYVLFMVEGIIIANLRQVWSDAGGM